MNNYRILHLEDSESDSGLIQRELKKGGLDFDYFICDNEKDFRRGLAEFKPNVILCDHDLPQFNSVRAFDIYQELKLEIVFILVTGNVSEEYAVEMMKKGIDDYILKGNLHRLVQAIQKAFDKRAKAALRKDAELELAQSARQLNKAQELAHIGSWEIHLGTGLALWSDESYRILGLEPGEVQPSLESYLSFVHKDDLDMMNQKLAASMNKLEAMDHCLRIVQRGGAIRNIYTESRFEFNEKMVPVKIHGIMQDITDKVMAEREKEFDRKNLSALINNTIDLMWSIDLEFNLITSNQAFDQMFLLLSGHRVQNGETVLPQGFTANQLETFRGYYQRAFQGETFTEIEYHEGSWASISFNPIKKDDMVIGTACYARDITEEKLAKEDILNKNKLLKNLTSHLQHIREEERKIISREIHDELGQQLTALKMDIDWVLHKQSGREDPVTSKLKYMLQTSDTLITTIRRISSDLRPAIIDDLGLIAALEWKCNDFEEKTGIPCKFVSKIHERKFDNSIGINAFRILQETLTNITRHAAAHSVDVSFSENEKGLCLEIADDGKGISDENMKNAKTLGIIGMKERAALLGGSLVIEGAEGKGTRTTLILPLDK